MFDFHPSAYTNDPFVIAQNDRMIAINSAIEVDLTGQVCADSIGQQSYSGFGGQLDFIRGAARSKDGSRSSRCLPRRRTEPFRDRAPAGRARALSPRAPTCTTSSPNTASRTCTARRIRQRAEALIAIAHPKFRNELYEYCERRSAGSAQCLRYGRCEASLRTGATDAVTSPSMPEECKGCGLCVESCPPKCLELAPELNQLRLPSGALHRRRLHRLRALLLLLPRAGSHHGRTPDAARSSAPPSQTGGAHAATL